MSKLAVVVGAALVAAGVLGASPASAQFSKPEDAIKYRQATMTLMGAHLGRIAQVVRGNRPFDAAEVRFNAGLLETLSKLPFEAYVPGTDKGDTRAKPEIWSNPAGFKAASEEMQKAVTALSAAAGTGSLDKVKASFGAVGKACKACHDDFRKD